MASTDLEQVRKRLGDRYAIERELGRGGMGTVYLARDVRLDRAVALKVLPAEFAVDAALRERFLRETRTSASFSHPNIVPVHAVEESEDLVAFAMGYVEGESLAEKVRRSGPLGVRELVRLLQDVGYALAYAHGRGVVHRDIKPDNVMIERATGRALVMDFGIARAISAGPLAKAGLTRVGEVVGTPEYMSPEQASADAVDGRSDIYSLGLVAFFAATGRTAMAGPTSQRILIRQLTEPVPPLASERPGLPEPLTAAIDRCVAKDPVDRFASAEALVEAIDQAQLAAPEIPIQIRGLAQELSTLLLVSLFMILLSAVTLRNAPGDLSNLDRLLLPLVIFFGIAMTRVLQAMAMARRLAEAGFSPTETLRGLRATVDEQDSLRSQLKLDLETHRRRRKTLIMAGMQLPGGVALLYLASRLRVRAPNGGFNSGIPGIVLVISGLLLISVSVVLIIRSPFRMPPGERVFRWLWLGPIGRAFIRRSARGVATSPAVAGSQSGMRAVSPTPPPVGSTVTPVRAHSGVSAPTLESLDARLAALEQWRREQG